MSSLISLLCEQINVFHQSWRTLFLASVTVLHHCLVIIMSFSVSAFFLLPWSPASFFCVTSTCLFSIPRAHDGAPSVSLVLSPCICLSPPPSCCWLCWPCCWPELFDFTTPYSHSVVHMKEFAINQRSSVMTQSVSCLGSSTMRGQDLCM